MRVAREPDEVRPAWETLEREGACTPFQTEGWLRPWYRIVAPHVSADPVFVTVTDSASGRPVMLFPLALRREGRLKVIEFADLGVSDYNAPLVARGLGMDDATWAALWRAIRAALPKADLLRLDKIPAEVEGEPNPLARFAVSRRLDLQSWGVPLPASRAGYDQMLAPSFVKELRRKGRRLEGRGAAEFRHAETEAEGRAIFAALAAQRQERFEALGRSNILAEPVFRAYYEAVLFERWPDGPGHLSALFVGDEIVAALFALRRRAAYHLIMSTFASGPWKSASPGNVAIDRAASALIASGTSYLDFTIGNEPYKRDFGATPLPLFAGQHALSLAGLPDSLRFGLKAHLSGRLGPKAMERIRTLRDRASPSSR